MSILGPKIELEKQGLSFFALMSKFSEKRYCVLSDDVRVDVYHGNTLFTDISVGIFHGGIISMRSSWKLPTLCQMEHVKGHLRGDLG